MSFTISVTNHHDTLQLQVMYAKDQKTRATEVSFIDPGATMEITANDIFGGVDVSLTDHGPPVPLPEATPTT